MQISDALEAMQESTGRFLGLLDGISDAQWRLRPDGEEWSIAETVEHVVLTDRAIGGVLQQLAAAPIAPGVPRFDDAGIHDAMFRSVAAPPGLAEPKGRFASRAEGHAALVAACESISSWVAAADLDLRQHGVPHPVFGLFDGVQWILFAAAHTDSHAPQLRTLRAHSAQIG